MAQPQKKLVLYSAAFFVLLLIVAAFINNSHLPEGIDIPIKGHPTAGSPQARVEVVVFIEPKCSSCKEYETTIFPRIKEAFIDTGKIIYTVIPVSFLPNSMPAAEALLCVYNQDLRYPNDDLFFTYLNYIYAHQPDEATDWATPDTLLDFARNASPAINIERLRECLQKQTYRTKVERNSLYAQSIMGGSIRTPSIYVDGILVKSLTYDDLKKLIETVLEKKGHK